MNLGRVGLIAPGGGFKCAFQTGCLLAFKEANVPVDIAQGISGGALNIAKHFENGPEELRQIWLEVEKNGPSSVFSGGIWSTGKHVVFGDPALFSDAGLNKLLDRCLTDLEKLINNPTLVEVVVRNEVLNELEVITNHQFRGKTLEEKQNLRRAIKASASIPVIFPPQRIGDYVYSDPGEWVLDSFSECDTVFILDTNQSEEIKDADLLARLPFYKRGLQNNSFHIDRSSEMALKEFVRENGFSFFPDPAVDNSIWSGIKRIARNFAGRPSKKRIVCVHPEKHNPTLMLDSFEYKKRKDISLAIDQGYECTKKKLAILDQ